MGLGYLNQKNRNYALSIDYFKKSVAVNIVPKQVLSWKVSSIMNLANISYYCTAVQRKYLRHDLN